MKVTIRFSSMREAEREARRRGFFVGPLQRDSPRGIHRGAEYISKWRGLSEYERNALHGRIEVVGLASLGADARAIIVVDAAQWIAGGALDDGNGACA